jgi:hypothetical protein
MCEDGTIVNVPMITVGDLPTIIAEKPLTSAPKLAAPVSKNDLFKIDAGPAGRARIVFAKDRGTDRFTGLLKLLVKDTNSESRKWCHVHHMLDSVCGIRYQSPAGHDHCTWLISDAIPPSAVNTSNHCEHRHRNPITLSSKPLNASMCKHSDDGVPFAGFLIN